MFQMQTEHPRTATSGGLSALASVWRSTTFKQCASPLVFLVIFVGFTLWIGRLFVNVPSRMLDIHQNVPVLVLALAAMITLVTANFDLSIASLATLTTFLSIGLRSNQGWPMWLVILACLGLGVAAGLANGLLVVHARINTFIATLGTGGIFLGLSAAYSGGTQMTPGLDDPQLPGWFSGGDSLGSFTQRFPALPIWIGIGAVATYVALAAWRRRGPGISGAIRAGIAAGIVGVVLLGLILLADLPDFVENTTWLTAVLFVVTFAMWVLMSHTRFGRHLYAIGANAGAARLAGVPVQRETVKAFVLGGVLAAVAGVLLASTQGSAAQGAASGLLLPAFAAAFLSTVIFSQGQFTVWGTVVGGIFLIWVSQGLIVGGVEFTWTDTVNGLVLLVAVLFAAISQRRQAT